MSGSCLLLWLVVTPLLGALVCVPLTKRVSKYIGMLTSLVGVGLGAIFYCRFNGGAADTLQMAIDLPWIPSLLIQFGLAADGLSFPLVCLTKLIMPIAFLASWKEDRQARAFAICLLVLDAAMTGTFLSTDIFLFYVFWEMMLIPMLLLIGVWGSQNRIYAALKFFLFTFAGSILMLAAIVWLYVAHAAQTGSYSSNIQDLLRVAMPGGESWFGVESLVFWAFTLAFAVKVPLFPLHTWLPDAHVQAPTGGSIILAAVLLKMGTYGLLRFSIPLCPNAFTLYAPVLATLSLIGIVYGAWVAFQQTDMKKLIAYSSVSHLGFVVLGICSRNEEGLTGAMLQMVNHGLSTGALFLLVGMLYERRHSRDFADFGGIAEILPRYSFFLVFAACSSMAVPGLNGFLGEFLILLGAFKAHAAWGLIALSGVVFGALYTLWMLRQVLFGPVTHPENRMMKDMTPREWLAILPLFILILFLGIYPRPFLSKFEVSIDRYWSSVTHQTAKVGKL